MSARSTGCVYCGLPRARVRSSSGRVVTLVACLPHSDLPPLDPFYGSDSALVGELAGGEPRPARGRTKTRRAAAAVEVAMPP